jgi:type IV pilus assembly protein PilC
MITIGEQGGVLQTMLKKNASHYENEVENTIEKILPLPEPAMMALLGLLLGGLITALCLPVFQMGTVSRG